MCASEQRHLIDTTIARTPTNLNLRIRLLTLESENCKLVRSMIAFEIMAKKMEYKFLVARTRASMNWEIKRPFLEDMAKKNADTVAELNYEDKAFREAEEVADAHIRQAQIV